MSNATRLEALIETKVPKRYKPTFTRFLDTSNDDELIGAVADLVEGNAITAALRTIGDSKLAVVALGLAKKLRDSFVQYVQVMRSEETMNIIMVLLARNTPEEVIHLVEAPLAKLTEALKDGYSEAGKELARDYSAAIEGMRPSNLTITFGNVSNEARAVEAAATNTVYTVRDVADRLTAIELPKDATQTAIADAREARLSAERAMKSIQSALQSAAQLRNIPDDVTGAISNSARAAIQAAEDAMKLAERAQNLAISAPQGAREAAINAAQAAANAAREATEAKQLSLDLENLARGLRPSVGISFDPTNPRAAQSAQELAYNFTRWTDEQRDVVRRTLTDAIGEGKHPKTAARDIRDAFGLTAKQDEAVKNYRKALEANSTDSLNRALRDRRFDPTVRRAAETDTPLTPEQVDRMVDRYRERFVAYRADTIALTEATTATSMANHEAMLQTVDAAGLDPDTDVEKRWNSTLDGRTRPSHVYLGARGGQIVRGMDGLFMSGLGNRLKYPGDLSAPAGDRVRCRCVCSYRII